MGGADDPSLVRAAGGVPWRPGSGGRVEVLVVHRPRYDDWTFPKGKLDPGEGWEQAAVREVFEETALVTVLGAELPTIDYVDQRGRPKRVRYWAMAVAVDTGFVATDEIAARRWLRVDEARPTLSYSRDRAVLDAFDALVERGAANPG